MGPQEPYQEAYYQPVSTTTDRSSRKWLVIMIVVACCSVSAGAAGIYASSLPSGRQDVVSKPVETIVPDGPIKEGLTPDHEDTDSEGARPE